MTIETHRFRNDTQTRKRLMVPESFAHPAKGQLGLWALMVERYSQPGDLVLDPMAGSGATLLAALMGRNVICVELEQHFVDPMRQSWAKMRTMPMLGHEMGQAVILRGDARCLPLPDASVGAAITSPPFGGEEQHTGGESSTWAKHYSNQVTNKGYTRPVDAIVTSPPFGDTNARSEADQAWRDKAIATGRLPNMGKGLSESVRYTRPVDAIVTSPPWEDKTALQDSQWLHSHEAELAERFRQAHAGEKGLPGNTRPENRTTMEGYTMNNMDLCRCGDYRSQHEGGTGACEMSNDLTHGFKPCKRFRLRADAEDVRNFIESESIKECYCVCHGTSQQRKGCEHCMVRVDSIITSPPFASNDSGGHSGGKAAGAIEAKWPGIYARSSGGKLADFPGSQTNIGNQRGGDLAGIIQGIKDGDLSQFPPSYWLSMARVYAECWRVLRPGGIMALVLKGFTREGKYIDLPGQTEALLLEAGWQKHDHWRRELWSLSFWRILQKRRDPAAWDDRLMYETVLAFRKPDV